MASLYCVQMLMHVLVMLGSTRSSSGQCTTGVWFGKDCKFLCHCQDNSPCNGVTGECPGQCASGWFGPACQYVSSKFKVKNSEGIESLVTDGDDTSCTQIIHNPSILIEMENATALTWIRLVGEYAGTSVKRNTNWKVTIENDLSTSLKACDPDQSQTVIEVDEKTVDIFCPSYDYVQRFQLHMKGAFRVCTIYISGGRNVALRQAARQSSTSSGWIADNAVNGKVGTVDAPDKLIRTECTHTTPHLEDGFWTVTFSQPSAFSEIVIYNRRNPSRKDCCQDRLKGFKLEAFSERSQRIFEYTDQTQIAQNIFTLKNSERHPGLTGPVKSIKITKGKNSEILTLCEVMVFGDSVCPSGMYGRECDRQCNCAGQGECIVSTGGCPSGCAPGYTGEDCYTPCSKGKYGSGCKGTCSVHCADQEHTCNSTDGSCTHGCEGEYQPPLCRARKACAKGSFGPDCEETCSEHCLGEDRACSHKNGSCDNGCEAGYIPPLCTDAIPDNKEPRRAGQGMWGVAGGIIAVILATAAVVIVVLVWRLRAKAEDPDGARQRPAQDTTGNRDSSESSGVYVAPSDSSGNRGRDGDYSEIDPRDLYVNPYNDGFDHYDKVTVSPGTYLVPSDTAEKVKSENTIKESVYYSAPSETVARPASSNADTLETKKAPTDSSKAGEDAKIVK